MASMTSYESNINKVNESAVDRIFMMGNTTLLLIITVIILLPLIFIVAASFSSAEAVIAGRVTLWPVDFSLLGYETIFEHKKVWNGFANSLFYTFFGTIFNVFMTIIAAYPLSRQDLVGRRFITFGFIFTMLFSGGLIPTYMVVRDLGLLNTRWAMILPTGIGPFNLLITITFFRTTIPPELIEAARIDGASDFRTFRSVILPLARPIIAVLALFYAVNTHWNTYFQALIYLKDQDLFPLQIVLREILIQNSIDASMLIDIEDLVAREGLRELLKYSLIVVASVPVMIIYPFVQRHFVKGMMIGSVK
ncbi:MAG: carbohydrate ABC transporter permease [Chloroflexota bacterium]|nr:carbohydrate ABC transporter permease [Chloroflexota bacterium]MDE2911267.1 carbohydrate ABC transporter permease [Chloroflexota bacterium]